MASSVVATVVVVAVTVAVAVALVGYVAGIWSFSSRGAVMVAPDSSYDPSSGTLCLHLLARGGEVAVYRVEVEGAGSARVSLVIRPGGDRRVCVPVGSPRGVAPGAQLLVRLYGADGGVYVGVVRAVPGSFSAGGGSGGSSYYGSVVVEVSSASSLSLELGSGAVAFVPQQQCTLVFTDSSTVTFSPGDVVEVETGGAVADTLLVGLDAGLYLSLSGLPALEVYRGSALVAAGKTVRCTSRGSAATCLPCRVSALDVSTSITLTLSHATVMVAVDGSTVLSSTDFTGRITLSSITPTPPTRIYVDPSTGQAEISGVEAYVTIEEG